MIIHQILNRETPLISNILKKTYKISKFNSNNYGLTSERLSYYNINHFIYNNFNTQRNTFSTSTLNNSHVEAIKDIEHYAVLGDDSKPLDLNLKQLCRSSHQSFLIYSYNNFDFDTIVKITNQVLAPYQTVRRKKTEVHRKQYLSKFLKCISKHKPLSDHEMVAKWLIRSIDLLTSHDMYSMLRDNSFETLRTSYGMDTLEKFSNVQKAKELRDKILEEKAVKNKGSRRNLLMRYLKINKIKFLRDQNITKAVYESNIEWNDEAINNKEMNESNFAFIYNLPYIEIDHLKESLIELLSKFANVKNIDIITDRVPPLVKLSKPTTNKVVYEPKDKYSPLHAIVEFYNKEDRDRVCYTNLRIFGILFKGRIIYPEYAEYKHSLITALYPPFKKMSGALQFIANTLVDVYDDNSYEDQSHELSTCKITPFTRRRKKHGNQLVVTAEKHPKGSISEEESKQIRDNQVDSSMLEVIKNNPLTDLDPQWIVLRFNNFKSAYFARQKLVEQLSCEPRSFVSFDTKRSVFHNGKYIDLPLFTYSQNNESDISYSNLSRLTLEMD